MLRLDGNSGNAPRRKVRNHTRGLVLLCAAFMLSCAMSVLAQRPPSATEYQVKAAFLYNFAKFVEWPSDSFENGTAPIQICILGRDDFGQELEPITQDKIVNGRRIEINHVVTINRAMKCHVLFVSSSERARTREILSTLQGKSILTTGDEPGFARAGGIVNFVLEESRVRFEINLDAANQAHLKISSKLLALAKLVRTDQQGVN